VTLTPFISTSPDFVDEKWGVEFRSAITLSEECGVKVRFLSADKVIENT
jgi:hypothetical protein